MLRLEESTVEKLTLEEWKPKEPKTPVSARA